LEQVAALDTVVLDKTGTLTKGEPEVVAIVTQGGVDEGELLRLSAAVELESEHPLADAIVREARRRAADLPPAEAFGAGRGAGAGGGGGGGGGGRGRERRSASTRARQRAPRRARAREPGRALGSSARADGSGANGRARHARRARDRPHRDRRRPTRNGKRGD